MNSHNINPDNTGRKSSRELRNQVMNDIQRVKDDIDEIKQRLSPGQIIDDALFFRHPGASPADTYTLLKQNPIGTSFLTLGTLLLMEDDVSHKTYEHLAKDKAHKVQSTLSGAASDTRAQVHDKLDQVKASVREHMPHKEQEPGQAPNVMDIAKAKVNAAGQAIKEKAQKKMDQFSETASSESSLSDKFSTSTGIAGPGTDTQLGQSAESLGDKIKDKVDQASERWSDTADSVRSSTGQGIENVKSSGRETLEALKEKSQELYQDAKHLDPLTYMVLGAGLGTLTGASLPMMETEKEKVDQVVEDKMLQFKSELEAAINESINTLKNELIGGATNINLNIF
jgi:hypothetical protein